jgi:hypothetical protein
VSAGAIKQVGGGPSPAKPVSGGQFPGNKEKNREYCRFSTISTKMVGENVNIISVLPDNCLRIGAGNIIVRTGNWFSQTGIYWCEYAAQLVRD